MPYRAAGAERLWRHRIGQLLAARRPELNPPARDGRPCQPRQALAGDRAWIPVYATAWLVQTEEGSLIRQIRGVWYILQFSAMKKRSIWRVLLLALVCQAPQTAQSVDYWACEDPKERERLPLYQTIPAAKPEELTPANGYPKRATFLKWERSHGDNSGARYSALDQVNRQNVSQLQMAWTYHSRDGAGNIQCNPIVAEGLMFAPTPARFLVAVDASTGVERWRFRP